MHVAGMSEPLNLVVDGEDFEYQAAHGDYSDEDRAAADARWTRAEAVAHLLRGGATRT